VSKWEYGKCDKNTGKLVKNRKIVQNERDSNGKIINCPQKLYEEEGCPVKCEVSDWESNQCDERIGKITRTRKVLVEERDSRGKIIPCSSNLMEEEGCSIPCGVSEWSYGKCNFKTGKLMKTREVLIQERNSRGEPINCPMVLAEEEECAVDCKVSNWGPPRCNKFTGIQTRTRKVRPSLNNGKPCPPQSELVENTYCKENNMANDKKCDWQSSKYCIMDGYNAINGSCIKQLGLMKDVYRTKEMTPVQFQNWLNDRKKKDESGVINYWERCKDVPGFQFLNAVNYKPDRVIAEETRMKEEEQIGSFVNIINNEELLRPVSTVDKGRDTGPVDWTNYFMI
jgi:hypothetical protein